MSARHLFNSQDGLVVKGLRGLVSYNTNLALIEGSRVVYDTTHSESNVAIISGGGAGHEPAWPGYVGTNMLAAAVSGDVFASPNTSQVVAAIDAVPSKKGHIICVGNYTGDALHFGLACEKANSRRGAPCGIIIAGDDVSVGKKGGSMVGRRGLAGQIGILKVLGGASASGASFDDTLALGQAFASQIVSIAATLDHCHVPGRTEAAFLKENEVELGTGPHNEPGRFKLSPQPDPESFIKQILSYLLNEKDPERGYVHFEKGDETILMLSNFGGMSNLELSATVDELLGQLEKDYGIQPARVYHGTLESSLNAPAFSTSIVNITAAAKKTNFSVAQIKEFLDLRTSTQWESMAGSQKTEKPRASQFVPAHQEPSKTVDPSTDLKVDPALLEKMLKTAADNLIKSEPDLTRWDTIMGDGDCGETLKTGANAMLSALQGGLAKQGSAVAVLYELENIVENRMGGTLGGILGIFFVSMTAALQKAVQSSGTGNPTQLWATAVTQALANLQRYTPAKVGDRTVMDVFIPFAQTLGQSSSFDQAVQAAVDAAENTKKMTPRLGRATYVGLEEGKDIPPDPGAWGAMEVIRGLKQGMS